MEASSAARAAGIEAACRTCWPGWDSMTELQRIERRERMADVMAAVRRSSVAEAAERLETMHFLFTIQRPGTGPFTRQDITMREVVEQGAAAIRELKDKPA